MNQASILKNKERRIKTVLRYDESKLRNELGENEKAGDIASRKDFFNSRIQDSTFKGLFFEADSNVDNGDIGTGEEGSSKGNRRVILDNEIMKNRDSRKNNIIKSEVKYMIHFEKKALKTSLNKSSENSERSEGVEKCPFCGSANFIIDSRRSEVTCGSCGLVLEENIIDASPRGTSINREGQNLTQNGAPSDINRHDNGMPSTFSHKESPLKDMSRWKRLRKWNNQSIVGKNRERNLSRALSENALLCSQMSLPKSVRTETSAIYRRALGKDLIRGRSISLMIAASLYAACRICNVPRSLDEIAKASGCSKKSLRRNYNLISRELKLNLRIVSPVEYIPRFTSKLNLSNDIEAKSIELVNLAKEMGLTSGKNPTGIAAASIYYSTILLGERRTQSEIAKAVGVTEVTIRTRYKEMLRGINL